MPNLWQPARDFVAPQLVVKSIAKWLGRLSSATSAQPPGGSGWSQRLIALTWNSAMGSSFRIWEKKWLKKYCRTAPIDSEVLALLIAVLDSLLKPLCCLSLLLSSPCLFYLTQFNREPRIVSSTSQADYQPHWDIKSDAFERRSALLSTEVNL